MITVLDVPILSEVLRKICQHSAAVRIDKTKNELMISSMSTDELSSVSAVLKKPFFQDWDNTLQSPLEIESRMLYDVSKVIQTKSSVRFSVSNKKLQFDIKDRFSKKITIHGLSKESDTLKPQRNSKTIAKLKVKSKDFLSVITQLGVLLDEAQLFIKTDSKSIIFMGKRTGMNVEMHLDEISDLVTNDEICVEFPVKFFQYFTPLVRHFDELLIKLGSETPLEVEGCDKKWKLILQVSKIERPASDVKTNSLS